jgi:hypothetical protein
MQPAHPVSISAVMIAKTLPLAASLTTLAATMFAVFLTW